MADITNLRRYRKQKAREEKAARASENRAKFGRSGKQKTAGKIATQKAVEFLDGHKRQPKSADCRLLPDGE